MISRLIGNVYMKAFGWKLEGELPEAPYVLIAAPHTSNWDMPFMMAVGWSFKMPSIYWLGKHTLFEGPFGWFMKAMGGIGVDRRSPQQTVQRIAEFIKAKPNRIIVVPPEGTRSARDYWKSGFYRIAAEAQVPIVCGFLDYKRKTGGFGPSFVPSGDVRADMDLVRKFYADRTGKFHENFTTPRLREEDEQEKSQAAEG